MNERSAWRCWIGQTWSGRGRRLYIMRDDFSRPSPGSGCTVQIANGFTFVEHPEGDCFDASLDGIPNADQLIQAILDKAWESGFRPSGFSDVKNETSAIKAHLKDMRVLAFHKIGAKLVD